MDDLKWPKKLYRTKDLGFENHETAYVEGQTLQVIDKMIDHAMQSVDLKQFEHDIVVYGKYVSKDGKRVAPEDMYKSSQTENKVDCLEENNDGR